MNGATSGLETWFGPVTLGAGGKTRLESSVKKFTPHFISDCPFARLQALRIELASQSHLDLSRMPYVSYWLNT
jgi:hypothetical protein